MKQVITPIAAAALLLPATNLQSAEGHSDKKSSKSSQEIPHPMANAAEVPEGFQVEVAIEGLTYPTSVEFDEKGTMYVAEGGYSYGDESAKPRILIYDANGERTGEISEGLIGPINDLLFHDSQLYISHRGKISTWENDAVTDLVTDLPSHGDHHNNQLTAGPDGKLYFGQGVATNSGVVGKDNWEMGWLRDHPDFHDVPPVPIKTTGKAFSTKDFTSNSDGKVETSAFRPFGTTSSEGETIEGHVKSGGTILRMNPDGSQLEVYAWGLRNPYGLAWGPDGKLYVSENGFDIRGSRPIANDKEDIYLVKEGAWYGWPDYASGIPVTDPQFKPENNEGPEFLLAEHPPVEKPLATYPKHSSIAKIAFSPNERFGGEGSMFVAFFGHMAPMTGNVEKHGGHRVLKIDPVSMAHETFLTQKSHGHGAGEAKSDHTKHGSKKHGEKEHGHAKHSDEKDHAKHDEKESHFDGGHEGKPSAGPRRLLDIAFSPDGNAMYVVDFGAMLVDKSGITPKPGTGLLWKISPGTAERSGSSDHSDKDKVSAAGNLRDATVDTPEEVKAQKKNIPDVADIGFKDGMTGKLFHNYLEIKYALANSDPETATEASGNLAESFNQEESPIKRVANELAKSDDIETKRKLFADLTEELAPLFVGNHSAGSFYKHHCPMAFNHQGGYWFSDIKTVRNPYFGDKMKSCGEVVKEYAKD